MANASKPRSARLIRNIARSTGTKTIRRTNTAPQGLQIVEPKRPQIVIPGRVPGRIPINFTPLTYLRVIRPDDLFNGVFKFHNMHRNSFVARAERKEPGEDAFLTLELSAQAMGEQAINQGSAFSVPLKARMAGKSRIAVQMPQGTSSVRLTLEALLEALTTWPLSLDPLAQYSTRSGLNRSMLESVEATFVGLNLMVWGELAELQLFSIVNRASTLGAPLVDSAYQILQGNLSFGTIRARAQLMRNAIEVNAESLADEAVEKYRGSEEEWVVRETAEAQLEVYFALQFARRILNGPASFSAARLNQMSGLFDLMMHPHLPASTATALEVPYRLITSPGRSTYFHHAGEANAQDYARGTRAELWHSRLRRISGIFRQDLPPEGADFYAMWSPDYVVEPNPTPPGFQMSLKQEDRRHIVKRTTGHNEEASNGSPYAPIPAKVRNLVLTPLGASLDAEGSWPASTAYEDFGDLIGWLHRMDYGRESKVVVTRAGWLYPSGFPVSQVEMTERRFRNASDGSKAAPLEKRTFLVVNQAVLRFPEQGQHVAGRAMPFQRLEAITRVTPNLQTTQRITGLPRAYWLRSGGRPFKMEMAAIDDTGRTVRFAMTQIFVPGNDVDDAGATGRLATAWNANSKRTQRTATMAGQVVRMVPGNRPEMDLPLHKMELRAEPIAGNLSQEIEAGRRPFHPMVERVEAGVPGLEGIPGAGPNLPQIIRYGARYLNDALGDAKAVALEFDAPIPLDFEGGMSTEAMGALGQASQELRGIALGAGLVPLPAARSLDSLIDGGVDWDFVLPDFKVLGRFAISQLLGQLNANLANLPTFTTRQTSHDIVREWKLEEQITRTAQIGPVSLGPFSPNARALLKTTAKITIDTFEGFAQAGGAGVGVAVPTNVRDPQVDTHGSIRDVALALFDLIEVRFTEITFDAGTGRKPDVRVMMDPVDPMTFDGPLEFLNGLKDLIPPTGFGDGPRIVPRVDGIEAGFDLGLPNLELGVFALKNMSLGATTTIPFRDGPVDLRFNFNERHRPFELAVSGFGGGGFFAMVLDTGGIQEIEAALEFGAVASMNIGVASGSVSVKGGVYFRYASGDLVLEGYIELRGRMSVLGLITASLLFHMALAYEKIGNDKFVRGEATLRIEVEVLFFSTSVTLHVERRFSAGPNDPRLSETVSAGDWAEYCDAFA